MGKILSVEYVVRSFVSEAFSVAIVTRGIEDFENKWYEGVSRKLGLTREELIKLHQPIWWELISDFNSPLEYVSPELNGEKVKIRMRKGHSLDGNYVEKYSSEIIKKYTPWFEGNIKNLLQVA